MCSQSVSVLLHHFTIWHIFQTVLTLLAVRGIRWDQVRDGPSTSSHSLSYDAEPRPCRPAVILPYVHRVTGILVFAAVLVAVCATPKRVWRGETPGNGTSPNTRTRHCQACENTNILYLTLSLSKVSTVDPGQQQIRAPGLPIMVRRTFLFMRMF